MDDLLQRVRRCEALQQPEWGDPSRLRDVQAYLRGSPALIRAGDILALRATLARVARGEALVVQCGVFITVTVIGAYSGSIYYLALLIVQSILMGATIDYGILFTNYYREHRRTAGIREALERAYEGSVHTILTSGLILVLITAAVGRLFEDETVTEIIRTLSIGSLSVILLILFILPGTLAACDKLVTRKKDRSETET